MKVAAAGREQHDLRAARGEPPTSVNGILPLSSNAMDPLSIDARAMAPGIKEAASKAAKDVYDGLSAGSTSLVATNLDSTILGAKMAISILNGVTVFVEIIPVTESRRAERDSIVASAIF